MVKPFVGTWKSEWLSYDNNVQGTATLTVTESDLSQPSGEVLNGMWDAPNMRPGTLYGTLSGNIWSGEWWVSPNIRGAFTFNLENEGKSFSGTYNSPDRQTQPDPFWRGTLTRNHEDVKAGT
jgi:hypothetical protein